MSIDNVSNALDRAIYNTAGVLPDSIFLLILLLLLLLLNKTYRALYSQINVL